MTSITIHDLDDAVAKLIRAKAKADRTSLNQTIKRLLEAALGVRPRPPVNRKHFEKFSGTWSKADLQEFERATRDFERIDPREWR